MSSNQNGGGNHNKRNNSTQLDLFVNGSTKRVKYTQTTSSSSDNSSSQVVPNLLDPSGAAGSDAAYSETNASAKGDPFHTSDLLIDVDVPAPGTAVNRKVIKRVGKYLLGPKIGNGPVECISQYLARREHTYQYFHLKILVLNSNPACKRTTESEKQGKLLLHSEFQLLKMLENEDGVIRSFELFSDYAFEEEPAKRKPSEYVYTGRVKRRIVLVVDCLSWHGFDDRSSVFTNLQQFVIKERNLSENKTLLIFYEIIKIVENLHKKNIVHRDLKLRNIILNTLTQRVTITNFCLGKQLLNENDYLHDQRGSPAYISPDVLSASHQNPYKGKPSDIWALGVVLFTMLYSQFPFFETKPAALFKRIKSVDYKIPKHTKVSEGTQYLIKNMLLLNPDDRLTATEIREHIEKMISEKRQFFLKIDQVVPEINVGSLEKEAVIEENKNKAAGVPTFELSRQRFGSCSETGFSGFPVPLQRGSLEPQQMTVQRNENDARLLTQDEQGQYSNLIRQLSHSVPAPRPNLQMHAQTNAVPISQQMRNLSLRTSRQESQQPIAENPVPEERGVTEAEPNNNLNRTRSLPGYVIYYVNSGFAAASPPLPAPVSLTPPSGPNSTRRVLWNRFRNNNLARVPYLRFLNRNHVRNRTTISAMQLDEAAQAFFDTLNDMFSRGLIPNRATDEQQLLEFNGELTAELAEKISDWLIQECSETVIVRDIFGDSSVNAKEKVLELLRRCGVQIEVVNGVTEIKREQTFNLTILLTYMLQASGYNNSYFA